MPASWSGPDRMPFTHYLKALADRDTEADGLREPEAHALFSAMLARGVPDLELGVMPSANLRSVPRGTLRTLPLR